MSVIYLPRRAIKSHGIWVPAVVHQRDWTICRRNALSGCDKISRAFRPDSGITLLERVGGSGIMRDATRLPKTHHHTTSDSGRKSAGHAAWKRAGVTSVTIESSCAVPALAAGCTLARTTSYARKPEIPERDVSSSGQVVGSCRHLGASLAQYCSLNSGRAEHTVQPRLAPALPVGRRENVGAWASVDWHHGLKGAQRTGRAQLASPFWGLLFGGHSFSKRSFHRTARFNPGKTA
ncbi:hypothetical protein ANO11243_027800 [Dothideomycetidae sp. 11243]|nr:hypothetical protein ANO11243_027800 [fungal sp. No.11243]